ELGEVEARLLAQPEVREAVVVAGDGPGGARLVGYVSATANEAIDPGLLRERLGKHLPDYMVPSAIVVLESLPLNANGKVDRKALPEPEYASNAQYEAPQGEVEETLAAIWAEVLGMDRVGVSDNFFDLGGHSLLLIRVHRMLEDQLHPRLSLIDLFKYPTIPALAQRIKQGADDGAQADEAHMDVDVGQRRRAALLQRKRHMERIA
ncbi:MAG: phosphopantetheine-binding protein, partial [Rhodocyclaceae bacterium]